MTSDTDESVQQVEIAAPTREMWTDYIVGVVRELRELRVAPPGAELSIATTLPIGAGLSSSAALTVSAAKALSLLAGKRLTPAQLAEAAFRAEFSRWASAAAGWIRRSRRRVSEVRASVRDCDKDHSAGAVSGTAVDRRDRLVSPAHRRLAQPAAEGVRGGVGLLPRLETWDSSILGAAGARGPAAGGAAAAASSGARVRHVVTETARTRVAARALAARDLVGLGRLLLEGHASLRDDYESTIPEADLIVELRGRARGVWGAADRRWLGRCGGSCWRRPRRRGESWRISQGIFNARFGRWPETWSTRASAGVRREAIPG